MQIPPEEKIEEKLPEGKITDEGVAKLREMIGIKLRLEYGGFQRDATIDTITNFSNGVGDFNPLFRDPGYGRWTRFSSMIAHPIFPISVDWPGRTRWGLPGVHGFGVANDWEFYRVVRPGDRLNAYVRVLGAEEKQSSFSKRLVIQYTEHLFTNQRDEPVARTIGICTRHERQAAREVGKYSQVKEATYSDAEIDQILKLEAEEPNHIRGAETRYWEDVREGEQLPSIVRGPLSLQDITGFLVGCGHRSHAHGVLYSQASRHPQHYFRNRQAGGGIEYTGIAHMRSEVAKNVGVPAGYDYLPQRIAWLTTMVTNWMGDDGFLKRLRMEARKFNLLGDTTWCEGKVTRKYIKDDYALVDIDIWCKNQRGEVTALGVATVMLPSRDPSLKMVVDGRSLELGLPIPESIKALWPKRSG